MEYASSGERKRECVKEREREREREREEYVGQRAGHTNT